MNKSAAKIATIVTASVLLLVGILLGGIWLIITTFREGGIVALFGLASLCGVISLWMTLYEIARKRHG
jgi:hypothetical protein